MGTTATSVLLGDSGQIIPTVGIAGFIPSGGATDADLLEKELGRFTIPIGTLGSAILRANIHGKVRSPGVVRFYLDGDLLGQACVTADWSAVVHVEPPDAQHTRIVRMMTPQGVFTTITQIPADPFVEHALRVTGQNVGTPVVGGLALQGGLIECLNTRGE
jgi:hypothetical protein